MVAMRVRADTLEAAGATRGAPRTDPRAAAAGIFNALSGNAIARGIMAKQEAEREKQLDEPVPELLRVESKIRYWLAFALVKVEAIAASTPEVWIPLAQAVNIGMILCENGIGAEWIDTFFHAQDAIARAWDRAGRLGVCRLDGVGIVAITKALEIHDEQIDVALRRDLAIAERTMYQRHEEGEFVQAEKMAA